MITKEQALALRYGQELHCEVVHTCKRTTGPRGGVKEHIVRVRVSGVCKTWKTRPTEFRVPVKYGLYESSAITETNARSFHLPEDCMADQRWFSSSSGRIEFHMTLEQAESVSHSGRCDEDVLALSRVPKIRSQLDAIDAAVLRDELREYGAWDAEELADHEQNLQRILWLAGSDIREEESSKP